MQNQVETTNKKTKLSWIPLEGNPDVGLYSSSTYNTYI